MDTTDALLLADMRAALNSGDAVQVRLRCQLSQREVAAVCGVDGGTLSRWETGSRVPRGDRAVRYARLLADLRRHATAREDRRGRLPSPVG